MSIHGYRLSHSTQEQAHVLRTASVLLVDRLFMDYEERTSEENEVEFGSLWISTFLPPRFSHHYTSSFLKRLILCVSTVAWKLETPEEDRLASVAEELALYGILNQAESVAETEEMALDAHWRYELEDTLFEDMDFKLLFDPALDGIEGEEERSRYYGFAHLPIEDWFKPFREEDTIHPYLDNS